VYVAPNPFTYATRSDKRLLARLSCGEVDEAARADVVARAVAAPGDVDVALAVDLQRAEAGRIESLGAASTATTGRC
jgi:hypothetical protein